MATAQSPGISSPEKALAAEALACTFSQAVKLGDKDEALRCATELAEMHASLTVSIAKEMYPSYEVKLKVGVEDAHSKATVPVTMVVQPDMTIEALKNKVCEDYGFHPYLQTWVIGKRLAKSHETLYSHGVHRDGDYAFLYIQTAKKAKLTKELLQQEKQQKVLGEIIKAVDGVSLEQQAMGDLPAKLQKIDLREEADNWNSEQVSGVDPELDVVLPIIGWKCEQCTFINKPSRPGCEICCADRPKNYELPEEYELDQEEIKRMQEEEISLMLYKQAIELERMQNFKKLIDTEDLGLVPNSEEVECPICYSVIEPGTGATLRECLHNFCKECLKGTIINCLDAEVSCPYRDNEYACDKKLLDREIRFVLSQEEYQKVLAMRLAIAENQSENSYHCKTADCKGWCIFEDQVNEFMCPLCNKNNCLLCKAIHEGMNCKEYQDDLRIRAENDLAAKQTNDMLQTLVQTGEAMHCPKCRVIVQKKDGCDWICCLMCKTEICWVTKGPRWGPNGNGDTSGGCRCRINGVPCHPNCQNCH
ncbi:ranBP-type and C3HC4-type zinc finger-containing protein 1 isoform X1 [Polypterus senegalus]|uniref:ranBP-type and C3HC4-type zinc finger-containing protein 1 isoform X1 n=1 Tax=Polypterus senegalus TaxID=55291 RepID=UPI0019626C07|nr:ranBP-type and C3HC4-type zinc finger-containing protein 1 isoform X1 [Polypterus senegalus]